MMNPGDQVPGIVINPGTGQVLEQFAIIETNPDGVPTQHHQAVQSVAVITSDLPEVHNQGSIVQAGQSQEVKTEELPEETAADWNGFKTLEDFLQYCCPKCDFKTKASPSFIEHVAERHPKAKRVLEEITSRKNTNHNIFGNDDDFVDAFGFVQADYNDPGDDSDADWTGTRTRPRKRKRKPTFKLKLDPEEDVENKEYQCYYCGMMIVSVKAVKDHMRAKHRRFHSRMFGDPRPHSCEVCGATFETEKTKSNHVCSNNVDEPEEVKTKTEEGTGSEEKPASATGGGRKFQCKECNKSFDRRKGYMYHVVNSHTSDRNFPCSECNYKAKNQMLLSRHVNRLHKQVKPYLCPTCGKAFYDSWNMKNHVRRLHLGETIKKSPSSLAKAAGTTAETVQCEHCGKDYSSASALATHVKVQHQNITYDCDRCGKMFRSKDWRDKHVLIVHEGQKPFVCEVCGKAFGMKQGLKEHYIIVHEKNGNRKCDQCSFTAPNNSRLKFHVQTVHEKKAVYSCEQCSFMCYRKDGLKAHVDAVHEKKRPHKCGYCEGAFFLRRDKERHLLKFHNIDVKKGGPLPATAAHGVGAQIVAAPSTSIALQPQTATITVQPGTVYLTTATN